MLPLRHWVFDLDGTLTRAVHDFAAIRSALEIEPNADILQHLASLPQAVAAQKHAWLLEHERQLAQQAQPAQGAVELLNYLHEQGAQLAILTRNARELAQLSLKVLGVAQYFAAPCIIGRDEAAPKPDPQGLQHLAAYWQVTPKQLVLVGDFHFDLACARAAGALAILVNQPSNLWPDLAHHCFADCSALLAQLKTGVLS